MVGVTETLHQTFPIKSNTCLSQSRYLFQAPLIYTMLFFDEANTTDAIGLIKEILCDRRMRGVPLQEDTGLKIIAACNPYKR